MAVTLATLDDLYGPCIHPAPLYEHETNMQMTASTIKKLTGEKLKDFLEYTRSDAYLANFFRDNFTTLWLIDEDGEIRIALEEVVLESSPKIVSAPMPRGFRTELKLGHPALVEGKPARIGGELTLNPGNGSYYINNRSGRFGRMRTEAHLQNAAELFRDHGLDVHVEFLSSRPL